jgi:dTDP-glucose pyrophosphorylase
VTDPERYGVAEFDQTGKAIGIEEKPQNQKSHYATIIPLIMKNRFFGMIRKLVSLGQSALSRSFLKRILKYHIL